MHLITLKSLEVKELESIIDTSIRIKQNPQKYEGSMKGKSMYMLFEKTSTRTSLSFGLGFNEMGGRYFFQRWQDSNFAVGEMMDETRLVAKSVDLILARLKYHQDIEEMARFSPIPVINGCCDRYHPTQGLADCMTIKEIFQTYEKTLVYIGIWNNTFNSLLTSFPRLGGKLIGVCPILNQASVSEKEAEEINKSTDNFEFYQDIRPEGLKDIVNQADIVYLDTWIDMEFINNPEFKSLKEERIKKMMPYQVTSRLLKNSPALVMHDMPIHPGYEIEREVVEAHIQTILKQGENRRHVAKGIFIYLLNVDV